ncbi:RNA polymerase sigma-54 factor RpoN [hydrothermal vent metagenome]|uniref:RNA polymerase sigma-54 factor RpoN n=1 Tax=hydrothermal vent metagenome TaxID=652676 RepID=A0A3B0WDM6_9ZZZZ
MKIVKNLVAAFSLKSEFAARRNKLYRIAYSWCHDAALADDLVQETVYKAMKNAEKLRDIGTIDSWLYRILYNCWQDYLRVKGRNTEFFEMHDETQITHVENYQQSQIVKRVRASVEQLPLTLREVVTLADFAGFSYAEIAEITDVPIGTVMSRLFRARKNLKEQLLEFGSDDISELKLRRIK